MCFAAGWFAMLTAASAASQDHSWRAFRGNDGLASLHPNGQLTAAPVDLNLKWKRPLGSGYSGIVVDGPHLITAYTDGTDDRLICLAKSSGKTEWDVAIGPCHVGRDGSFDGPIATPVIAGKTVVMLTPQGRLVAINRNDGTARWSQQLTASPIRAPTPLYGFSSSPIVVDEIVIVLAGGPGAFAVGFELAGGKLLWKTGEDEVQCQSAIHTQLAGQGMVVAAGMKKLFGMDPRTGQLWFQLPHGGSGARGAMSIVPVAVGDNRLFIAHDDRAGRLYEVSKRQDQFSARPVWITRALANTYNVPVLHDQILFGYQDRILTAVDPDSGNWLYRSREPGDGFHIAVDRHLIVITKRGRLYLAPADRTGFQVLAQLPLFQDLVWTPPSYSDNAIYVRSLGEIARVDLTRRTAYTATSDPDIPPLASTFRRRINAIAREQNVDQRRKLIDKFIATHPHSPIIEDNIAHFYYRGPAEDVAMASPLFGARQERRMKQIDDLFYYAIQLPERQRADYSLFIDFVSQSDPRNTRPAFDSSVFVDEMEIKVATTTEFEPVRMSWFAMPAWQPKNWLPESGRDSDRELSGETVEHALSDHSRLAVYLPPGYSTDSRRYPVVYVHGTDARSVGQLDVLTDRLIRSGQIRPCLLVFLQQELGSPDIPRYPEYLVKTVIPSIDGAFRTQADRTQRSALATGFHAPLAMYVASEQPDWFGATGLQSPYILGASAEQVAEKFTRLDRGHRVYCEWGRFDLYCPTENWDMRSAADKLFQAVRQNPRMSIQGGAVDDTTGWTSWRNRLDRVLSELVGKPAPGNQSIDQSSE